MNQDVNKFNSVHDQEAKSLYENSLSSGLETPPDSGIRENNVLISFPEGWKHCPNIFHRLRELLCNDFSDTIVTTQSGL